MFQQHGGEKWKYIQWDILCCGASSFNICGCVRSLLAMLPILHFSCPPSSPTTFLWFAYSTNIQQFLHSRKHCLIYDPVILFPSKSIWENKLTAYSLNTISWRKGCYKTCCIYYIPARFHQTERPHKQIPQCERGRLELKATVNSGAPWPRHGPQGIGEVYQCWWCLVVTEPDWQLLSVCSLPVISSGHLPTPRTYQAPTTWLYTGHIYIVWITDSSGICVRVCMERGQKYPAQRKLCKCWNFIQM